jgi:hypothetical protein
MQSSIWIKSGISGLIASLAVTILIMLNIHVTEMAPFNVPPVFAFLTSFGLNFKPLALLLHFGYGVFWSWVFVVLFQNRMTIVKALGVSVVMWLIMMFIYSPIMGWGVAGFGAYNLPPDHALYLGNPVKYALMTLVVHLIYGLIMGAINICWIQKCQKQSS